MKTLIYLACPYSDPSHTVMDARFDAVNIAASKLMRDGKHIISPISHTHPIACAGGLPKGWEFWEPYDRAIISCCAKVIVLKLPGWDKSVGVSAEVVIAKQLGIHVEYMEPMQ